MAIVKMKRLRVVAMQNDRPALLEQLQRLGCVEIGQPDKALALKDMPTLKTPDSKALVGARNQFQAGELALDILKAYSESKSSFLDPRPVIAEKELFNEMTLEKAEETVTQITGGKTEITNLQAEKATLEGKVEALKPWENVNLDLDIKSTAGLTIQFGVLPIEQDMAALTSSLNSATELAELQVAGSGKDGQYAVLAVYTPALDKALEAVKSAGWSRTNFRGQTGTAKANIQEMENRIAEIDRTITQKEEALRRLGESRGIIEQYLDSVAQVISREEAQSRLLDTENTFFLEGWVEADKWPAVETLLGGYAAGYEVSEPQEDDIPDVPVKLQNSKFSRSLSIVTEMYSLPAYNGIDPNPLMAPFFIFFYGMMMADMGYGLLMIIGTQLVLSKAKPKGGMRDFCELFRMLGYSTFAIGAVTAGFFGNFLEALLKSMNPSSTFTWFWTAPFTALDNTIEILVASMVFGAVHVLTGMVVSFCKKAKDGKMMDGIMDEGSWWLLFAGIGMGVATGNYMVAYAGVAALVLTQGRNNKGIMRVVGGVASLYDITGYFGDILSYARLMALMLAGSVIAQVFNDLGVITGNVITFLIISLAGNTLNFLLNLLGCFVHTLRLQCLEFFGKFYMDGGRRFEPLAYDTTYVDLQEQNV